MALPETLPIASFADLLRVSTATFMQEWQQQRSATGGGETRYADRAPSLWKAELTTPPMDHAEAEGLMALANSRAGGLKTFLLYNPKLPFPSSDPEGAILSGSASPYLQTYLPWSDDLPWNDSMPWGGLGAFEPKLGAITDRLHVAFTGLPPGYMLPLGTYFSIMFDTSRFYLGQFAEARTADGSGAVTSVEIWPPLPASVTGTPDVEFAKPHGKFRLVPGSAYPSTISTVHSTFKFSAEQTYSP
ncbi:hypothetical protein [Devosia alba]|uniref:hypothetical protein n=1 Tax=Devosia alba TaxID=3152360 RepID=UPI0032647A51